MVRIKTLLGFIAIALFLSIGTVASAQPPANGTPDGETPADETVCDVFSGA